MTSFAAIPLLAPPPPQQRVYLLSRRGRPYCTLSCCISGVNQACTKSHKMVERLQGLCGQLEQDVEDKRLTLAALQAGTA